jgi:hypothetical protein
MLADFAFPMAGWHYFSDQVLLFMAVLPPFFPWYNEHLPSARTGAETARDFTPYIHALWSCFKAGKIFGGPSIFVGKIDNHTNRTCVKIFHFH